MIGLGAMAAISAVPAVLQSVLGGIQARRGRKMAEGITVPEYKIPEAAGQALGLARQGVGTFEMPGQDQMIQGLEAGVAGSLNAATQAATSSSDLLSTIANVSGNKMEGMLNIGANAAQQYEQRRNAYQNALNVFASYQEKELMDKIARQQQAAGAAAGLMNVGRQNIFEGIKTGAGVGANYLMLKGMYGGGGKTTTDGSENPTVDYLKDALGNYRTTGGTSNTTDNVPMMSDVNVPSTGFTPSGGSGMGYTMQQQMMLKSLFDLVGTNKDTRYYDPGAYGYGFNPNEE
jgi:hypothetical protein